MALPEWDVNEEEWDGETLAATLEGEQQKAAQQRSRLAEKEEELEKRSQQISGEEQEAEEAAEMETITDGTWQVGVDIVEGTYRAPGGAGCYWALLNSADTNDIHNNGFAESNPTVTIDTPWFETDECGEWEKIE